MLHFDFQNEKTQILSTFLWLRLVSATMKHPGLLVCLIQSEPVFHVPVITALGQAEIIMQ